MIFALNICIRPLFQLAQRNIIAITYVIIIDVLQFIGNLPKLNCLDLSQNEIQEVSDEISKCTQIDDLTLNSNMIEVSNLKTLRI